MLDSIFNGFNMPEHHGCTRAEVEFMSDPHYLKPLIGIALERRDPVAHPIHEDLTASTRDGSQTSILEP